jgi:hypothetical protein
MTRFTPEAVQGRAACGGSRQVLRQPGAAAAGRGGAAQRCVVLAAAAAQPGRDLRSKAGDDTAAKVCLSFDLPLAQVPFMDRQRLRLARARQRRGPASATLCWVWATTEAVGAVIDNAYSRRVRYIVLRNARRCPGAWVDEQRDVAADFVLAFGDESATSAAAHRRGGGADADNTGGRSVAHITGAAPALRRLTWPAHLEKPHAHEPNLAAQAFMSASGVAGWWPCPCACAAGAGARAHGRCRGAAGHAVHAPDVFGHGAGPGGRATTRPTQCAIPLRRWLPRPACAGRGAAVKLDTAARTMHLADGRTAEYDVLSLDTGATMDRDRMSGAREHGLVRAADRTLRAPARWPVGWPRSVCWTWWWWAVARPASNWPWRCSTAWPARVKRCPRGPGHRRALRHWRVTRRGSCAGLRPRWRRGASRSFRTAAPRCKPAPCNWPAARAWPATCRCWPPAPKPRPGWRQWPALDAQGLRVHRRHAAELSHPEVFAVGDVATAARRAAPAQRRLRGARRAAAGAEPAPPFGRWPAAAAHAAKAHAQPHCLRRNRRAIVAWGGWSAQGRWAWWWKDRIDRAFIARYAGAAAAAPPQAAQSRLKAMVSWSGTRPSVSRGRLARACRWRAAPLRPIPCSRCS